MAAIKYDCYELDQWLIREKGMLEEECGMLSKRLVHFAHSFCKEFDEKICAYFDEASGTSFKKSKATEFLIGTFAGAVGGAATFAAGLGTSGFKPAQESGQKAYGFMANKPREKAVKRTLKIQELVKEANIQKLFIKIATNLFLIHQQQLVKFIDDEDWLTNVERLVEDAVRIILNYLEECEKVEELNFESMALMAFLNHKHKNKTCSKMDLMYEKSKGAIKKVGRKSKRLTKSEKKHWTFARFGEEKCGFVAKINEEVKYFWTPTSTANLSPPKYGFKLIPRAILELIDNENLQEYKPEEYYNYLLIVESDDELEKVVDLIKKIIANCATGINKDMHREIIDLRRHFEAVITRKDNEREEKEGKIKREDIIPAIGNFTGRSKELTMIHEKLNDTRTSEEKAKKSRISPTVVVCGMGGIGKTELTRKYIEVHGEEYSSASSNEEIYWINAENAQNIANMQTFYKTELKKKLEKDGNKVLIVLDNVNTLEDARALVPRQRFDDLHVIITSRITVWKTHAEGKIETIRLIDFEGAYELLVASFPSSRKEDIEELIETLEGLPLALQQAIAYINDRQSKMGNYTIKDYLQEFEENTANLLNTNIFKDCLIDSDRYNFKTVLTTFNISFELLKQEKEHGKEVEELMYCIAYLRPSFKAEFIGNKNALYVLEKYSLIKISGDEASVHRLVQEVARLKLRNVPNLEEIVLRRLLCTENILYKTNLKVFSERLHQKPHIIKEYCHKTRLCEISLNIILRCDGEKIFETMVEQECFNWREESVKETLLENMNLILKYCDVNISCEVLNKLQSSLKNPIIELFDSISYFIKNKGKRNFEEVKQQAFKLIALLCNDEEKSKEALLEHLSQIKDANLIKEILEMSDYYMRKQKFSFINDLLKLAIKKDHPGILSNYLLEHLKQRGTRHLEYAIDKKNKYAFWELANEEYIKENKNILINKEDEEGNIFDYAYIFGTLKMVKHLVESVGFKNSNDLTFNLIFYMECEFEVFEYAFCNGVINARIKDSLGRSALFYAANAKRVDLFEFLIRLSEKCFAIDLENEQDIKGNTLLHYALSECYMYNGQDDVDKDYIFSTGFILKEVSLIKVLLNAGAADPSKANVYGQTAFMLAAYWDREEAIKCLLPTTDSAALSLIVNQRCCDGRTALHYAAMRGNCKAITNLISKLSQSSKISFFCDLHQEVKSKNAIGILLKYGADANEEDNFGCLPLHYACMAFRTITDCELFGFKWEEWPSLKDRQGNTPFHCAAIACNTHLLLELREIESNKSYGESLNIKNVVNEQNRNLLHSLAINEEAFNYHYFHDYYYNLYKDVVDWLMNEKQLDLNAEDIFGHTPMDIARKRNNQQFIKAIK